MSYTIGDNIWDSFTVLKKSNKTKTSNSSNKIKDTDEIAKKNSNKDIQIKNIKLDNATEAGKHSTIPREYSHKIIQGRIAKKWKQCDLAKKINVNKSVINDYECGKAIINHTILNKIEKQLNIKMK